MMKPKAALVKDGFLPPGSEEKRGRLSGAAIERCKALAAQGWNIEGYSVSKAKDSTAAPTVEKVKVTTTEIADIGDPLRDETFWQAYANNGKTLVPVGMRTVCNTCHNSITYCPCKTPRVWILDCDHEVMVNFKPIA